MSSLSKRRIVHVGLPKAASTLLQHHILDSLDDYLWLGPVATANIGRTTHKPKSESVFLRDNDLRRFYDILLHATEEDFRQQLALAIELEGSLVRKYERRDGSKGVIFSSEFLTSTFFSYDNVLKKADRVHAIWPDARIIIVIREQYSMLVSQYVDQPFDPRNMSESRAIPIQTWLDLDRERGDLSLQNSLDYLQLYKKYCQLFGQSNIHVLLFEDIVNNKSKFADDLCRAFDGELDTDTIIQKLANIENAKPGAMYQYLRRLKRIVLPKLHVGGQRGLQRLVRLLSGIGPPIDIPDHEDVRSLVRGLYRQSNQELDELANLEMSRYGYTE